MSKVRQLFIWLIIVSLSACSMKPVKIVTYPAGAQVVSGSKSCISPCVLQINDDSAYVTATLPDGRSKKVKVSKQIAEESNITGNAFQESGVFMEVSGITLAVLGLISGSILLDGPSGNANDDKNLFLFSLAALGGGSALISAGAKTKKLNKVKNRIDIDFASDHAFDQEKN